MTDRSAKEYTPAILAIPCPRCGARPAWACSSPKGVTLYVPHLQRKKAAKAQPSVKAAVDPHHLGAVTMDEKDRRIAKLETALAEKTRQWEAAKRIAVEQGHHRIQRERAEAENARLRHALTELGGERAVADALRGPGPAAPREESGGIAQEHDASSEAEAPAMRF